MKPTLDEIQKVFFDAMANGWAQGVQEISISEFPGTKAIPFVSGDFRVLDCYTVTPYSNKSTGTITIWHQNQPVWVMHYGGWYVVQAIPFLKSCLHQAYVKRRFYGGRGPSYVQDTEFIYLNTVDRNYFEDFAGTERILDTRRRWHFGYHWYRGMWLVM